MKIALLQPQSDDFYVSRKGYASEKQMVETGLAVLSSYVSFNAPHHEIVCLDPHKSNEELARQSAEFDIVGFTDWFSNHQRILNIASQLKSLNKNAQVVIGGPNTQGVGKLLLEKYTFVDYACIRDGENSLLGIANGIQPSQVPNVFYRDDGAVKFTQQDFVNLNRYPNWDFSRFENLVGRLGEYREVVVKSHEPNFDPFEFAPITIFSFRGCMKAILGEVCSYCTSAETVGRSLSPKKFWEQIFLLQANYNGNFLFIADDIFPVSLTRMEQIAAAKPSGLATPMIRAYAYMPDFIALDEAQMERMTTALRTIGIFDLFFGIESFGVEPITRARKAAVGIKETERVIRALGDGGVKSTVAYLLGLPGESNESLKLNLRSLEVLLETGYLERIVLSVAMALRGTAMFDEFCQTRAITEGYERSTGRDLISDDYPDYALLQRLGVKHLTRVEPAQVNEWIQKMVQTAERYFPSYRIGGDMMEI